MVKTVPGERRRLGAPPIAGISAHDPNPYGWTPAIVLFIVSLVDRVEHNLLSGVLPLIQAEWGFSDIAAGSIPTAAALTAALVALPAGYLADRRSRTRIIAVVVPCWALITLGTGLATGFAMFYAMRVLLAAAESIDNPASGSLLADFYPPATRLQAYGWTRITGYLGGLGTLLGAVLGQAFGWRSAFLIMVIPGLLAALLCWRLREPPRGHLDQVIARATPSTGAPIPVTDSAAPAKPPFIRQLREVVAIPTLMMICAGVMIFSFGLAGIHYWTPSLMVREYGLSPGSAGAASGLISIIGVISGTFAGASLGRRLHRKRKGGRLLVGGTGITLGSLALGAALLTDTAALLFAFLLLSITLFSVFIPNGITCIADVLTATTRGLGFALLQLLITVGAAFSPLLVGVASDSSGSLTNALNVLIAPMVLGGLITLAARRTYERDAERVMEAARQN
jgi:MFS family permease